MRTQIAENEFIYLERFDHTVDERQAFDKRLLHDPGVNNHAELPWTPIKLAIFRHPLERAFSDYKMTTRWGAELTTDLLRRTHFASMQGLGEFYTSDRELVQSHFNVMTKTLVGKKLWDDWLRETSITSPDLRKAPIDRLLRIALDELERTDIIMNMSDLSLIAPLTQAIAQSVTPLSFNFTLNTFNSREEFKRLSTDELQAIRSFNEADLVLWDEAMRRVGLGTTDKIIKYYSASNDTQILDFSRGIPADNIWPRETNGRKSSIWTGNNGDTTFYFRKKSYTRKHFCMHVSAVLNPSQFENLKISLNEHVIPWKHVETDRGFLVIATIEQDMLSTGRVLPIKVSTPTMAPSDPADRRKLGLELSAASLVADWDSGAIAAS
jgi:hypothetical protein